MASIVLPRRSKFALALREPNLLVHGKKPFGAVQVNHNTTLTNGLRFAFINSNTEHRYANHFLPLLVGNGDPYLQIENFDLNNYFEPVSTPYGQALKTVKISNAAQLVVDQTAPDGHFLNNASELSVLIVRKLGGTSAQQLQFRHEYEFTLDIMSWTSSTYDLVVSSGGAWNLTGRTAIPCDTANDLVVCGAALGGGSVAWFGQGMKADQKSCAATINPTAMTLISDTQASDNLFFAAFMWDRKLSDAEMIALTRNPYLLLAPANDTPYLFPVAGGGGVSGIGDLVGAGSEVVGTGTRTVTGTGALEGQGAEVVGTATRTITGTGALVGQGSDVTGTGAAGGTHTGTGDLVGAGSEIVGVGERAVTGTGALVAQGSAVAGVGERTVTGSGDLVGAGAEVSGSGAIGGITTGTGDLVGAGSEIVGTGLRTVTGSGALVAQGSAVTGTGERTVTGAGALVGSGSEIVGAGVGGDVTTGAGALVGQGSAVTGTGTRTITGVGELVAAGSIIVGSGLRTITGSGVLVGAGSAVTGSSAHAFVSGNTRRTWLLSPRGREWSLSRSN